MSESSLESVGPGWVQLPASSDVSDTAPASRRHRRTWGGGGGTCHECRKSNATKGPLFMSESCQAQLRGGRKHIYHLACLKREYANLKDSDLCPACSGGCVCRGGFNAHPCKVSQRPSASSGKDRVRTQMPKPSSGADSDSRSWPADTDGNTQSSAGTAAGERTLAEMNVRRSLRTAGTHRSYHLPDDDDDVPDLERSDSIVSSLMSSAGDSFSVAGGPAEALRAAAAAVAPGGWSVSAAKFNAPGGERSIPLFCFSRAGDAGSQVVSDVVVAAPLPPCGGGDPLALDDTELSPALLAMLNDIAPRSVLEMCLADDGADEPLPLKAAPEAAPLLPARRLTPGPVWATTMPPPFPGPAPVPFQQHSQAQLPAFWFGQAQQQLPQSTWMPDAPATAVPVQTQSFWTF